MIRLKLLPPFTTRWRPLRLRASTALVPNPTVILTFNRSEPIDETDDSPDCMEPSIMLRFPSLTVPSMESSMPYSHIRQLQACARECARAID